MLQRPSADEHVPYFGKYIALVPDGDLRDHLQRQMHEMVAMLGGVPDDRALQGYAPGKWTLKEALQHVIDGERVFTYRMLRIARGDTTPLPGFEQDDWVPQSGANARSMQSLLLEYCAVRASTILLVESVEPGAWVRRGTASGHPVSARALAYVCAGHDRHHQQVLRERYLV